ncbi:phage/plasmid primase, P4 family [Nonomuraea wenchangensis]
MNNSTTGVEEDVPWPTEPLAYIEEPDTDDDTNAGAGHGDVSDSVLADLAASSVLRGRWRWCVGLGWLQWDGQRWAVRDDVLVSEVVRQFLAAQFGKKVEEQGANLNPKRLQELQALLSASKVRNVTTLARGIDGISTLADQLDANPDLLNTPSGVVDLRTGKLSRHNPELLMTKLTQGSYIPDHTHRDWETALEALPKPEREWFQTRAGQAVTGHTNPDGILVLMQGGGENGKSLLSTDGLVPALGDYADVASAKLLSTTNEHSEEMATLRGKRFLVSEEMTEGRALNIAAIKRIQDVGTITARHVYKSNMTFKATHALFATTNYLPVVNETDHGTWRRLALLVFPYTFRKPGEELRHEDERHGDPRLKARIKANRSGQYDAIVTWVVEGAMRWYANPDTALAVTDQVAKDTRNWRAEADRILGYWDECLIAEPAACVITTELHAAFNEWLASNGHNAWPKELFHPRFKSHTETSRHGVVEARPKTLPEGLARHGLDKFDTPPVSKRPVIYKGVRYRTDTDASDQQE